MDAILKEQKRLPLMAQALTHVRETIISGKLKPGERLIESQLAERMQICRLPIREALKKDSELAAARLRIHLEDAMTQIRKGFWTNSTTNSTALKK